MRKYVGFTMFKYKIHSDWLRFEYYIRSDICTDRSSKRFYLLGV